MAPAPEAEHIIRSTRDPEQLRARFEAWLRRQTDDAGATVDQVRAPEANGMSSETLLIDATIGGQPQALVARVAPDEVDVPVFPTYDLEAQFLAMRLVGEHSDVPVPPTRWMEPDPDVLGAPFFVMDRVEGRVPPDNLPYTFEGWLLEATDEQRRHLQDATVGVLAGIHGVDVAALEADGVDLSFLRRATDGAEGTPLRRHVEAWRRYYDWVRGDGRYPLVEAGFAWLDEHWPADEGDTVISWGDARIGNMMYEADGWDPVAVFDWEMVALGPRGIDLGWATFLHTFFQDVTVVLDLPGLPDFMAVDDVAATYRDLTDVEVGDLDWYTVYAALRHGIVMARVNQRMVHFGEAPAPTFPDEAIMHRERLAELLGLDPAELWPAADGDGT